MTMYRYEKKIKIIVGRNLKKYRLLREYSQDILAIRSEISRTYISDIETGKKNPTIFALWKLSKGLDVTVRDLIKGIEK